ncbi:hypothetical protein NMY22_g15619 [Coprinellus aureogranulatus]|nr:hypothetical protein NMY22_g15619 [Coprinellus aureogranulatus]
MKTFWFWAILTLACFLAVAIASPVSPPLEKRAKALAFRSCTVPNTVALTFDDGPYDFLSDLVDTLNKANVKGTFFFNGKNWRCVYDEPMVQSIKKAFNSGHQLASHTWSHKDLTTLSWDQIHNEMWKTEQAIQRITGATPAFVRPPFGNYNDLVLEAAGARGLTISNWDLDSEDGKSAPVSKQKGFYDAAVKAHPSTILSLEHEVHSTSVYEVLPYAIEKLKSAGYQFVTVAECLNMRPYQSLRAPGFRDVSETSLLTYARLTSTSTGFLGMLNIPTYQFYHFGHLRYLHYCDTHPLVYDTHNHCHAIPPASTNDPNDMILRRTMLNPDGSLPEITRTDDRGAIEVIYTIALSLTVRDFGPAFHHPPTIMDSPRIRSRTRVLQTIDHIVDDDNSSIISWSHKHKLSTVNARPGSDADVQPSDMAFELENEIKPRCKLRWRWAVVFLLLFLSAALAALTLLHAFHTAFRLDIKPPHEPAQDGRASDTHKQDFGALKDISRQGGLPFAPWQDGNATRRSNSHSEKMYVPPKSEPEERDGIRRLRRYPTIDRSILAKFGGLDPDGLPGEREIDDDTDTDSSQSETPPLPKDPSQRWPTILFIPEGRLSQKGFSSSSPRKDSSSPPLPPLDPPTVCGPSHPTARACRFLFPLRMAEQESKSRIHFTQVAQLARRLNRILVLPNVGKSRMGACYRYPFETYYDLSPFFIDGEGAALHDGDADSPGYVTLDNFRPWSEALSQEDKKPIRSRLLSVAASVSQDILDSAEEPPDEAAFLVHRYPTEVARESEFPGCFPSKWPQLQLGETSMYVALESQKQSSPPMEFGEQLSSYLKNMDILQKAAPGTGDGGEAQEVVAPSDSQADVLILNWDLRRPVFSPHPSDISLQYSHRLQNLATKLAPSRTYLAIHWRMETVETEVLQDCAHSLVATLSSILHDTGHLGSGIEEVWFASDYPYPIAQISTGAEPLIAGKLAKSGTFKTFGDQHETAVGILTRAFQEDEELANWKLVDISRSIQGNEGISADEETLLKDTGVLGILDKLIATRADLFVSGSRRCSRQSSFTRQVIENRQRNWKNLRNVITAF